MFANDERFNRNILFNGLCSMMLFNGGGGGRNAFPFHLQTDISLWANFQKRSEDKHIIFSNLIMPTLSFTLNFRQQEER